MARSEKEKVLISVDWFPPTEGGGGLRTAAYAVGQALAERHGVYVLTGKHHDTVFVDQFSGDNWHQWTLNGWAQYLKPGWQLAAIQDTLRTVQPQTVLLLNIFSWTFTIQVLIALWLTGSNAKVLVAPSGMLTPKAIKRKTWKKRPYFWLLRRWSFFRKVTFLAASEQEREEVKKIFPNHKCQVAYYPSVQQPVRTFNPADRASLCAVYLGRIESFKGLHRLLEALKHYEHPLQLTIAGPIEDQAYWKRCQHLMSELRQPVTCQFVGTIPHHQVLSFLNQFHVLVMPSENESFGYSILEALQAGTPVLVTHNSPWSQLEKYGAGYQVDFDDQFEVCNRLASIQQQSEGDYERSRRGAKSLACEYAKQRARRLSFVEAFSAVES